MLGFHPRGPGSNPGTRTNMLGKLCWRSTGLVNRRAEFESLTQLQYYETELRPKNVLAHGEHKCIMTTKKRLRANWSKRERDFMFHFPTRSSDGALLHHALCKVEVHEGRTLVEELEARGFDISTLKFSIELKEKP